MLIPEFKQDRYEEAHQASCGSSCACKEIQRGQERYVRMGAALLHRVFLAAERSLWHMGAECCHLTDSGQKSPANADSDISALRNQATLKESLGITVWACSVRLTAVSKQIGLTARNTQASSDCVGSRGFVAVTRDHNPLHIHANMICVLCRCHCPQS